MSAKSSSQPDLQPYVDLLKRGEVVAFPTETVYGLGADAWNPGAIRKVFETKGRPADNPLIVHVASKTMVQAFAADVPAKAGKLMDAFWPGPLTLIFRKKPEVLDFITAGLDTVALRMPDHPLALQLIEAAGPLVAPSANTSGRPSPTQARHVREDFGPDFPVVDGGACRIGLESTLPNVSEEPFEIFRPGYVSRQALEKVLGRRVNEHKPSPSEEKPRSPGMKYSHYSPEAQVRWMDADEKPGRDDTLYLVMSANITKGGAFRTVHYDGDYARLARELYDRFRQADRDGMKAVAIEDFRAEKADSELTSALLNRIGKAIGS